VYKIEFTNQYLKDLRLLRKRNFDEAKLNDAIRILISGKKLPVKHRNHHLAGEFLGLFECHIIPDWLLIYSVNKTNKVITLIRTGTHVDLF
jgi:mRNA interferase YafQ